MPTLPDRRPNPAPFTPDVLEQIATYVQDEAAKLRRPPLLLDPFAGTGRIHRLAERELAYTIGIELEPEWAAHHRRTLVGNALHLPFPDRSFQLIATSPVYGNRFSDSHDARDSCKRCKGEGTIERGDKRARCPVCRGAGLSRRRSYTHDLGRRPSAGSAAVLQWGDAYRSFHERAWQEALRVLDGRFILNISDHYRNRTLQPVTDWHVICLGRLGMRPIAWRRVPTPRMRQGQNHESRVAYENVIVFERAA